MALKRPRSRRPTIWRSFGWTRCRWEGSIEPLGGKVVSDKHFLAINGDNYRIWHPRFGELSKDIWNYSKETQVFSNVFTEQLIEESLKNRFSFVVGGTMRSSSVPMRTAEKLRSNGFETVAFAIAASKEFSLLNAFLRFLFYDIPLINRFLPWLRFR